MGGKAVLDGNSDKEKFADLCSMTHKEQIIWFLNAFWTEVGEANAETLWKWCHTCTELDLQFHEEGSGLDEMNAHRFLEIYNETMTVRELRESLRSTGAIDAGRVKLVPITYILIFKYKVDWHELVNRSQGDNREEMEAAQKMLDEVKVLFKTAEARQQDALARENDAREAEAPFKAAQEELEAALAEVKSQEDAYNSRTEELKQKSETGGVVSRNKAANELAQHLAEDPLPLRKAKITLEAARKRAEKTRAPFEAATKEAEAARQIADKALADARAKVQEAENYLNEVKSRPGQPYGALWWIDRELHEAKAYVPESKGGYRKK